MTYWKALAIAIALATAIIIATLVLIASSDDDDSGRPGSNGPSATFVPGTGIVTGAPTPTLPPGEAALNVPEEGGVVPLAAGAYRTSRFRPEAHFTVREGWSAAADTARFVHLFRGDDPGDNCVCFINPDGVIGDDGRVEASPATVDEMIDWLTSNPALSTSNPSSLQVGDLSGRQLDVELAEGSQFEYLVAGDRRFGVREGDRQHLTVLDYRGAPIIIAQTSPAADYNGYFVFVEQIVGGLTFR